MERKPRSLSCDQFGHLFGSERFGVEHQIEQVRGGFGFAELRLAVGAGLGFQLLQQLAGGGPFDAAIEHQVADADIFRRDHVHAQHASEMPGLQFAAHRAIDHVSLGGQARQYGRNQAGIGFVGNLRAGAEFLVGEHPQAGLGEQFEIQTLRADACDFFVAAARMTRNCDQRHVTCSS